MPRWRRSVVGRQLIEANKKILNIPVMVMTNNERKAIKRMRERREIT